LTVCGSNDRLCSPRLRQAASPLGVMRGSESSKLKIKISCF